VDVEYEWIPPLCHKCNSFGHVQSQCPTKEVWLPKEASTSDVEKAKNLESVQEHPCTSTSMGGIGKVSEPEAAIFTADVPASCVPKSSLQPGFSTSSAVLPNAEEEADVATVDGNRTLAEVARSQHGNLSVFNDQDCINNPASQAEQVWEDPTHDIDEGIRLMKGKQVAISSDAEEAALDDTQLEPEEIPKPDQLTQDNPDWVKELVSCKAKSLKS